MGQFHLVVQEWTQPGESPQRRLCVDYWALNNLLLPVTKAHSKAKGVITLVPLTKFDEIYFKHLFYPKCEEWLLLHNLVCGLSKKISFCHSNGKVWILDEINEVLGSLDFAFSYLDDILIYSPDPEMHLKHIEIVFQHLLKTALKLEEIKYNFLKRHIQYLGHLIKLVLNLYQKNWIAFKICLLLGIQKRLSNFWVWPVIIENLYQDLLTFYDLWLPLLRRTFHMNGHEHVKIHSTYTKIPCLESWPLEAIYIVYGYHQICLGMCLNMGPWSHHRGKERTILHPITHVSGLCRGSQLNWATLTK